MQEGNKVIGSENGILDPISNYVTLTLEQMPLKCYEPSLVRS